jgi:hypothetical protein
MHAMQRYAGWLVASLVAVAPALAQNPMTQPAPGRPNAPGMPLRGQGLGRMRGARAEQLRMQIEERFARRVQTELGLSDQQMERLRATERSSRERRQALEQREIELRRAVGDQLQPGVAADADSLGRLLDAIAANHVARARNEQQEMQDLAQFLDPVQRARLLVMRQQLMARVQAILQGRRPAQPGAPSPPDGPPDSNLNPDAWH